jgi:hypothetical protein
VIGCGVSGSELAIESIKVDFGLSDYGRWRFPNWKPKVFVVLCQAGNFWRKSFAEFAKYRRISQESAGKLGLYPECFC